MDRGNEGSYEQKPKARRRKESTKDPTAELAQTTVAHNLIASVLASGRGYAHIVGMARREALEGSFEAIATLRDLARNGPPNARVRAALGLVDLSIGRVSAVRLPDQRFMESVFEKLAENLELIIDKARRFPDEDIRQWAYDLVVDSSRADLEQVIRPEDQPQDPVTLHE